MRRWEYRRPILGRLVWGWLGFAVVAAGAGAWLFAGQSGKAEMGKIALNVDEAVDRLAVPEPLRLAPPSVTANSAIGSTSMNAAISATTISVRNGPPANKAQSGFALRAGEQIDDAADREDDDLEIDNRDNEIGDAEPKTADRDARFRVIRVNPESNAGADQVSSKDSGELVITIDGRNIDDPRSTLRSTMASSSQALRVWANTALAKPSSALLQPSDYGKIPKVSGDGRRSAQVYARPYEAREGVAVFGIIVTGLGLNEAMTQTAIETLPGPVTLSFVPYGKNVDRLMDLARANGHEIILEVPMEGYGQNAEQALGPAGLLTTRQASENQKRLDWILSRGTGYFGVTNYLGAKFSTDARVFVPILKRVDDLGLTYIDDTGIVDQQMATPAAQKIMIFTSHTDAEALDRDLYDLQSRALRGEFALAKIAASPQSIAALAANLAALSDPQIDLAPASSILYGSDH